MMTSNEERIRILEMIENDAISAEEGLSLLQALEHSVPEEGAREPFDRDFLARPEDLSKWKRWWLLPLLMGIGITLLGGGWMYAAWNAHGFGLLFLLTWIPFFVGVGILALAWGSRNSPWLHLRIQQAPGAKPRRIAFSFPIPLRLLAWVLNTFGGWFPIDLNGVDEILFALKNSASEEMPVVIDVDEGEGGEKVQVIIA